MCPRSGHFLVISKIELLNRISLERALASSSGGAACPGVLAVHPVVDPRSQGVIPERFKQKKFCDGRTHERMNARNIWTDRRVG